MAKMIPLSSGSALLNLQVLDLDSDTVLLFLKSTPPHHLWNLLQPHLRSNVEPFYCAGLRGR